MIPTGTKVTIRESRTLASAVQLQSASNPGRNNIELTKVSMDKVERWLLDIDDNVSEAWRFTSKVIDRVLDEYARQVAWGFSRSFEAGSGDIQRRDRQDVRVVDVRGVGGQAEASPPSGRDVRVKTKSSLEEAKVRRCLTELIRKEVRTNNDWYKKLHNFGSSGSFFTL